MWDKVKTFVSTYWRQLAGLIAAVGGYLLVKDFFQKDLKAKLLNKDIESKVAESEGKKSVLGENIQKLLEENRLADERLKETTKRLEGMTPSEVEAYYKDQK